MSSRTTKIRHDQEAREHIQTIALVNRVQTFALAPGLTDGDPGWMHKSQLAGALALINKRLPNLSNVQLGGDPENPIIERIERVIVRPTDSNG